MSIFTNLHFDLLNIISLFIGAMGLYLTWSSNQKAKESKTIDWAQINTGLKHLSKRLKNSNFSPDYILAPGARSGIIAQEMAGFFDENIPVLIGYVSREPILNGTAEDKFIIVRTSEWYVYLPPCVKDFSDKKVLIVQDWVRSGEFLLLVKRKLKELEYKEDNIKYCSIAVTQTPIDRNNAPDYYYKKASDECYFPWGKAR